MTRKDCTVILGMHRSGSTVLAGCLKLMGVNLENATVQGDHDGHSGSFENSEIGKIHETLLRHLGCRWDMESGFQRNWEKGRAAKKAEESLGSILQRRFLTEDRPFAVGDPRMCRLMPLWKTVLANHDVKPCVVVILRQPTEVAMSLEQCCGLDLTKGHRLWSAYNREAFEGCTGLEYLLITFDQLLADPVGTLRSLAELSSLSGLDPVGHAWEILNFVRQELKIHHQSEAEGLKSPNFPSYAALYDQLRSLHALNSLNRGPIFTTPTSQDD
ncbi:MAG: hypothetical protein R6U13_01545, partial [Desulfatiglandaceae bacterium]